MIIYYSKEDDLWIATLKHLDAKASGDSIGEAARNLIEVAGMVLDAARELDVGLDGYLIKQGCVAGLKLKLRK